MLSDELYDLCLPVLQDVVLDDEIKTEKVEELLRTEASLTGKQLENAVLDALWRHRNATSDSASPPPTRHIVIRRASPAPWQIAGTPTPSQASPRMINPPPGLGASSLAFVRTKSSTASPFTSPRASPRLSLATPYIPHSPRLDAYQFSNSSPTQEVYGDLGSDAIEWLVSDEAGSTSSSLPGEGVLNGAAPDFTLSQAMNPYDMLRSILRNDRSNEEIQKALDDNNYDLSATLYALMAAQEAETAQAAGSTEPSRTILVGKSMSPNVRPATPLSQQKSTILCKYYLANGSCARADCRFSHDASKTVCKYWLAGSCLAGDSCVFSHDPSTLVARMMLDGGGTPPLQSVQPNFQIQDYEAFPALQAAGYQQYYMNAAEYGIDPAYGTPPTVAPPPGLNPLATYTPSSMSRNHSRPTSRHTSRAPTPSIPPVDDNDAFPTLGSAAAVKGGKKHHGKRGGHGHGHKESPSTLAELVRMSPSPNPVQLRKGPQKSRAQGTGSRENSAAAQAIPPPENIPWLATGDAVNKAYLKARSEAFKHGGLRNKFLQSAAQAYNRSDSRAAKALSLRGQTENTLMKNAHREAARILYEERNKDFGPKSLELFVDLHGLHPEEAVSYLSNILRAHEKPIPPRTARPVYVITGTGHHSKNGKDKVGKAVRNFLNDWRYAFREFSVPGDRSNTGGIIGIDPTSWDRSLEKGGSDDSKSGDSKDAVVEAESTKVRILRKEDLDSGNAVTTSSDGSGNSSS
ncbi:hypothetical protein EJ06DRAFT_477312 [Trichodelitschia bisporula]|uniref:CCCH zinc finger and SMR domain-containing protein n=1 Tax=Trichodelitschia bisporula TaxID=703511 RepID=A0A6G1HXS2_9PEZI|nr:hypothetical protein EJ06DRAFT_477312 [Trichodelitschia bisporula]